MLKLSKIVNFKQLRTHWTEQNSFILMLTLRTDTDDHLIKVINNKMMALLFVENTFKFLFKY